MQEYVKLIKEFIDAGYKFIDFVENPPDKHSLILRHDVDFEPSFALQMAEVENVLGVKSTYFFLVRSMSYNLFDKRNTNIVKKIEKYGHKVSIHFDPTFYQDVENGLVFEEHRIP